MNKNMFKNKSNILKFYCNKIIVIIKIVGIIFCFHYTHCFHALFSVTYTYGLSIKKNK